MKNKKQKTEVARKPLRYIELAERWERGRTVDDGYCPKMEETIENLNRVGLVTQEGRVSIGDVQLENVTITPHEPKAGEWPGFTMEGTVVARAEQPET